MSDTKLTNEQIAHKREQKRLQMRRYRNKKKHGDASPGETITPAAPSVETQWTITDQEANELISYITWLEDNQVPAANEEAPETTDDTEETPAPNLIADLLINKWTYITLAAIFVAIIIYSTIKDTSANHPNQAGLAADGSS